MKDLILIGGAAGTGKTTLTKQLADHFQIPWISTDQIRSILKIDEPDHMVRLEKTWEGVLSLINAHHPWEGGIIEGTAILPEFVSRDLKDAPHVKVIFITQGSESEIAKVIEERSKLPWIKTKTLEQQALKVREVFEFNDLISRTALEKEYPCIEGNNETTYQQALGVLNK